MKVITEAILRDELRASKPETYVIPEGQMDKAQIHHHH